MALAMRDAHRLVELAAHHEHGSQWLTAFTGLIESGLLAFTRYPGTEYALRMPPVPFSENAANAVQFCNERLRAAPPAALIMFDLSAICSTDMHGWLRQFLPAIPATTQLSVAADHPAARGLLQASLPGRLSVRYGTQHPEDSWRALVRASYEQARIRPVPVLRGRTLTALHAPERGLCAMPCGLFETAPDTAWCLLELDATRLGSPRRLRRQLAMCLRLADNLLDEVVWPRPALKLDALINRRVGIHINNLIGLLQQKKSTANGTHGFLRLRRWLNFVRSVLIHESMLLARARGPFPQLGAGELINELAPHYGLENARRLLRGRFLRHRHLLALSPFSLFPPQFKRADEHTYLSLLPVLTSADVISMHGPDPRSMMSKEGWEQLLRLVAALASR